MAEKKNISVLGAGLGSLSAVYELTSLPGWEKEFDITVWQLGWRAGGKMSGGRGTDDRIEELGLHLLLGFYTNAFSLFEEVYKERSAKGLPDAGYSELKDALLKNNSLLFVEYYKKLRKWENWTLIIPERDGSPSEGAPPLADGLRTVLAVIFEMIFQSPYTGSRGSFKSLIFDFLFSDSGSKEVTHSYISEKLISLFPDIYDLSEKAVKLIQEVFVTAEKLLKEESEENPGLRRFLIMLDFGLAVVNGVLKDVYDRSTGKFRFSRINHLDFRDWLAQNGASEDTLDSALVYFFYNAPFNNFTGSSPDTGNNLNGGSLAAGTAMQFLLQGAGYRGSVFNQMRLGTAETLIMPLYQVLKSRGVKFRFFHKVTGIIPSSDGASVGEIRMEKQVRLRTSDAEYDPVRIIKKDGKSFPVWTSSPIWDQIDPEQVGLLQKLEKQKITLESPFSNWKGEEVILKKDKDFDLIILGIPVPTLRYGSPEILKSILEDTTHPARAEKWRKAAGTMQSTQVMSAQLWFSKSIEELGFDREKWGVNHEYCAQNVVSYSYPVFSFLDQSQFLKSENWPSSRLPRSVIAFTNSMPDYDSSDNPDSSVNLVHYTRVEETMRQWLWDNMGWFFPASESRGAPQGINWDDLTGKSVKDSPVEKFASQFFMNTLNPSDRYVNAPPYAEGQNPRIAPDQSGFSNMVCAGDWTDYGYNFGYMEGTIVSGKLASQAVCRSYGLKAMPSDPVKPPDLE